MKLTRTAAASTLSALVLLGSLSACSSDESTDTPEDGTSEESGTDDSDTDEESPSDDAS